MLKYTICTQRCINNSTLWVCRDGDDDDDNKNKKAKTEKNWKKATHKNPVREIDYLMSQ